MPIGVRMPSCPSMLKPRCTTWITSLLEGIATERAASRARITSYSSTISPLMPTTPRLLMEETCAPAILTKAEAISIPELCSARSTERTIARDAASRSTITPFVMPFEGSMPTPKICSEPASCTRPTSVQTFVVPTSIPTTISSILMAPSDNRAHVGAQD